MDITFTELGAILGPVSLAWGGLVWRHFKAVRDLDKRLKTLEAELPAFKKLEDHVHFNDERISHLIGRTDALSAVQPWQHRQELHDQDEQYHNRTGRSFYESPPE